MYTDFPGELDFKCSLCGKSFNRKQLLDCHYRYDHEGEEPLRCDHCNRTFMLKRDIEKHMITHTGEKGENQGLAHKQILTLLCCSLQMWGVSQTLRSEAVPQGSSAYTQQGTTPRLQLL